MRESKWRAISRARIAEALAALPAGHMLADAKKAIYDAYPFGERAMLPYRMWCEEQRKALARYTAVLEAKAPPKLTGVVMVKKDGRPWIDVRCAWCDGGVKGGCIVCLKYHLALTALLLHPLRVKLWLACWAKEEGAAEALADWYLDQGVEDAR